MDISELLYDFFGRRIAEGGQYNPIEYLVYGAILLALAFFVIFPLLDRRGIKFNWKFLLALLPYILLGSIVRVLEDLYLLPSSYNPFEAGYWVVTPGIYVSVFVVTIACLFIAKALAQKTRFSFNKIFGALGLVLSIPVAAFEIIGFKAWPGVAAVIALVAAMTAITVFLINRFSKSGLMKDRLNIMVLASQLLDGNATFVSIQFFRCGEQHPLSGFFLNLFPFSFVLVKLLLVLVILHYVDKEIENENLRGFIKIVVAVLGFATGLRDLFTLGVGTCM